jgi:hypothetical protein
MKMTSIYRNVLIGSALMTLGAAAQADILAGGAMYGGPVQVNAVCYLYNAGTGPVTVTSNSIFREGVAAALPNIFDSCNNLAPGASCGISANVVNFAAHNCRMIVSPSGANVRGTFELRDGAGNVLNNVELR